MSCSTAGQRQEIRTIPEPEPYPVCPSAAYLEPTPLPTLVIEGATFRDLVDYILELRVAVKQANRDKADMRAELAEAGCYDSGSNINE